MSYLVFTNGGTPAFLIFIFIFHLTLGVLYYIILSKLTNLKSGGIMLIEDIVKLFLFLAMLGGLIMLAGSEHVSESYQEGYQRGASARAKIIDVFN